MSAIRPASTQDLAAPQRPVRLAAIGLGGWGQALARAYTGSPALVLQGCHSRDESRRTAFAECFGCRPYRSQDELLADPEVDGVVIAVPNDQHADVISAAATAGKHVFVEKPLAVSVADLARIRRVVQSSEVVLACGHTARRLAGVRQLKREIAEGRLGAVTSVAAVYGNDRGLTIEPDNWRADPDQCPGGPLTQIGIHHIDNLQYLLGPVRRVCAFGRSPRPEIPNELGVATVVEFEAAVGYLGTDWCTPGTFSIEVHATGGRLRYELDYAWWADSAETDRHATLTRTFPVDDGGPGAGTPSSVTEAISVAPGNHLLEEIEEFVGAVTGGPPVEVGLDAAESNVAVLLAAVRSLREGRAVDVADVTEAIRAGGVP